MSPEQEKCPEGMKAKEEKEPEEKAEEPEENGRKVSRAKYEKLQEELEKAKADGANWKNQYYKAFADTQNLRKSLEEESRNAIRYRSEGFLESLLPALDSFHMALDVPAPTKEAQNYQIGFTYIYNQIVSSLTNEGVSEIYPKVGDAYDEATMHAVDSVESADIAPNHVVRVAAKGYKLHDRLIRAAMVYVAKAPQKEEKSEEETAPASAEKEEEAHKA